MIVSLLISLLIIALLYWAAVNILAAFGIGEPVQTIIKVVAVVVAVVTVLRALGMMPSLL